jgi:phosphohistidine phosphatase
MDLILWRHAEAEDIHHHRRDNERELTVKGRKQAQKVAAWLNPQLPDDARIIVSPAMRTIQTAEALKRKFEVSELVSTSASLNEHLTVARWPDAGTAVLIGHQPTLGQIAALLMSGRPDHWEVKKGAIWWLRSTSKDADAFATLKASIATGMLE